MVNCVVRSSGARSLDSTNYIRNDKNCSRETRVMTPDLNTKNTGRHTNLYREEFLKVSKCLASTRWREIVKRPVLAPLAVKQNTDNIIANNVVMSKKRKSDMKNILLPPKRMKLMESEKTDDESRKSSRRVLSAKFKCMLNKSVVKLFDVFREIPFTPEVEKTVPKNEFMGFLGLGNPPKVVSELKVSHPINLSNCTGIPFSSDCGRQILLKRHGLSEEAALKKLERCEWYLKESDTVKKESNFEILPAKDDSGKYVRTYSFPKRQFSQNHQSLAQAFMRYACKPLTVKVERSDFSALNNKINTKEVSIIEEVAPAKCDAEEKSMNFLSVNCAIIKNGYLDDKSSDKSSSDSSLISPIMYNKSTNMFRQNDELEKLKLSLSNSKVLISKKQIFRRSSRLNQTL